jgi:hypothetical protein
LFPLKYKPDLSKSEDLYEGLVAFMDSSSSQKPHLESDSDESNVSLAQLPKFLGASPYSLIVVHAKQCSGCREVDSILPKLKETLGKKNIQIGCMNYRTEH